ncbi:hypothetical protein D3C80_1093300 [compost metagenome]
MGIVVVGDGLFAAHHIAFKAMNREVHFAKAGGYTIFFVTVEGQLVRVFLMDFQEVRTLHEHTAGATRRVEDDAVIRLQHVGDELHQRYGGEEFTAVMGPLIGKLGQEVLVNTTKDIPGGLLQLIWVQGTQELTQDVIGDAAIFVLRQLARQIGVVLLDGLHRLDDGLSTVIGVGQRYQGVKFSLGVEVDRSLL